MEVPVELDASSSTFDDQFCDKEPEPYAADIGSRTVATSEEAIERFTVLSMRYPAAK